MFHCDDYWNWSFNIDLNTQLSVEPHFKYQNKFNLIQAIQYELKY